MSETAQLRKSYTQGFGQLTLVEHSLCPLDSRVSLAENLVHCAEYRYSSAKRQRKTAHARVFSPLGLSASDELYLWGLLALTLSQPGDRSELMATPHWCLSRLGIVDTGSGRGGEQYRTFREALRRLSATSYLCDAFYDPVRAEHREVSFHFFSYSLPIDDRSSRAWRIAWDPIFYELVKHSASHFRFDLGLYRSLDPASRRLFLLVSKIFYRRETLPPFELKQLAVDTLGFSAKVSNRDLRMKLTRCLKRLTEARVVSESNVERVAKNHYVVSARRGPYFDDNSAGVADTVDGEPVLETLIELGSDSRAARRLLRKYPTRLLEEWADITQAKLERQGRHSFRKSPMAYLVDSVSKAHRGIRTPPDWWQAVRREEHSQAELSQESQQVFAKVRAELFGNESTSPEPVSTGDMSSIGQILQEFPSESE